MRFSLLAVAAAGLALAACTSAADKGEEINAAMAAGDPDRIICTREHVVGSNRPTKVCLTAAQRAGVRERSQEQLGRMRDIGSPNNSAIPGAGSGPQ